MSFLEKKAYVSAFGIIGRAVGSTLMHITLNDEFEKFLSNAVEQISPCERTFKQIEEYLIEKYQVIPHTLLAHELKTLKANVIMNYFDDVVEKPAPLGENPTVEEIELYLDHNTSFFQAREYPAEKLGLEMKAYKLLNVQSEIKQNNVEKQEKQIANGNRSFTDDEVIIEMEAKSGYMCIRNGGTDVMNDLTVYRGVSEEDIKEKSPRFIGYAYALKQVGRIK